MKAVTNFFNLNVALTLIASVITLTIFTNLVYSDTASTQVIVGNATPSVAAVEVNGSTAIVLTENTTTAVYATSTVTDSNGCSEITNVVADFYRSGVTASGCDTNGEDNNNSCYARVACTEVSGTCSGGSDTSADYVCSFSLQYYADPTDSGTYSAQTWEASVYAGDGTATSTAGTDTEEVNTLLSLNVTSSIDYGTLSANTDTGATNETTTVTNTGNVDQDPELSGTNMTSGGNTIAVGQQEYSATSFTYGAGTDLSTSPTGFDLSLSQPTSGTAPVADDVLWGIGIPSGQASGTYTGTNTFTAASAL